MWKEKILHYFWTKIGDSSRSGEWYSASSSVNSAHAKQATQWIELPQYAYINLNMIM